MNAANAKKNKREILKIHAIPDIAKDHRRHSANTIAKKSDDDDKLIYRNYSSIKVYSISNTSTRERLRRKIEQSKLSKKYVQIDWDAILA